MVFQVGIYLLLLATPSFWWWIDYAVALRNGYPKRHARRAAWSHVGFSCAFSSAGIVIVTLLQIFW